MYNRTSHNDDLFPRHYIDSSPISRAPSIVPTENIGYLQRHYEDDNNRNTPPASHFPPVPDNPINPLIPRQYGISPKQWSRQDEYKRQAALAEYAANRDNYMKNYENSYAPPDPPAPVPAPASVQYYEMKRKFIEEAFARRNEVYFYEDDNKSNSLKHGRIMSMRNIYNPFGKYEINTGEQIYKVDTVYTNNYDYSKNKKGGRPIKKVSRKRITRRRRNGKFSAKGSRRRTGQRGVKRK